MKLRRKREVNLDNLNPKIREGITVGDEQLPSAPRTPSGEQLVRQHLGGEQKKIGRLPVFRAVLRDDPESVWVDGQTDRLQRNVIATVERETMAAMQAGHICLRCFEPQPHAFPGQCDLCGYPMKERQIMDIAMEFRGLDHVGPAQPFSEFLAQQEERVERAKFAQRLAEGGSKGRRRG